ncbi:MAG: hypothetical protein HY851_11300 [candidate division Zixibacteria bacterium]|nr:hypothetical protein [candidate division Zixibacteria bacterium]
MAQKANDDIKRISEDQRFRYIGFEVFPGKPGDLFTSEAEKQKYVDQAKARRSRGQIVRDKCTLLGERVSRGERLIMTVVAALVIIALFMPWYSIYHEVPAKGTGQTSASGGSTQTVAGESANEEVITMTKIQRKMDRTTTTKLGVEGLIALATAGGAIFSSGFSLLVTALLFLAITISCLVLPAMTLYEMYFVKGDADQQALVLKKRLIYNWIPLGAFAAGLLLSFLGGSYGFDAPATFSSLGASYGPGAYLGSLTWGFYIAMAGSTMLALKGIEI